MCTLVLGASLLQEQHLWLPGQQLVRGGWVFRTQHSFAPLDLVLLQCPGISPLLAERGR